MKKLKHTAALCAALCAALALGCAQNEDAALKAEHRAPDFSLSTPLGADVHLGSLRQSGPVLVVFWSVYCGACRYIIPALNALAEKYPRGGLSIIAVSTGDPAAEVQAYADANRLKYPVVVDGANQVARLYQVRGTPTAILIGKDGLIRKVWMGYSPEMDAQLEDSIAALLK